MVYMGMVIPPVQQFEQGTWLEPEEFTYPSGGFKRRAGAMFEDGKVRVVKCSIADTYFSIPARAKLGGKTIKGWLGMDEGMLRFHRDVQG